MRISEIIKKAGLKIRQGGLPETVEQPSERSEFPSKRDEHFKSETIPSSPEELSLKEERKPVSPEEYSSLPAEQIYNEVINAIKEILASLNTDKPILNFELVYQTVKKVAAKVLSADNEIMILVNKSTPDNYLYAHSSNVCILSIKLAAGLGWAEDKLTLLGVCALLHDVGMVRVLSLANRPVKPTPQEYEEVKKHPLYGKEILEKLDNEIEINIKELLGLIAYQHHERINGEGYPRGLKDKDLHEFVKIIGLVDVYEGLTHPRAYRERMLSHGALRYLIETAEGKFEALLLKIFIEELSLYPVGSFVKLNTEEIGEVVKSNRELPTRPVVKLILGAHSEKIEPNRYINLAEAPLLHIREPVDETKLKISDKELMLKLKVKRWWVR